MLLKRQYWGLHDPKFNKVIGIACLQDGYTLALNGRNGLLLLVNPCNGTIVKEFHYNVIAEGESGDGLGIVPVGNDHVLLTQYDYANVFKVNINTGETEKLACAEPRSKSTMGICDVGGGEVAMVTAGQIYVFSPITGKVSCKISAPKAKFVVALPNWHTLGYSWLEHFPEEARPLIVFEDISRRGEFGLGNGWNYMTPDGLHIAYDPRPVGRNRLSYGAAVCPNGQIVVSMAIAKADPKEFTAPVRGAVSQEGYAALEKVAAELGAQLLELNWQGATYIPRLRTVAVSCYSGHLLFFPVDAVTTD